MACLSRCKLTSAACADERRRAVAAVVYLHLNNHNSAPRALAGYRAPGFGELVTSRAIPGRGISSAASMLAFLSRNSPTPADNPGNGP